MRLLTVKQVAKLAGISVRALHHYDQIGLLKPASVGRNRYRYYGEVELLRLQQILIHRELDVALNDIGAILDAPQFDQLAALHRQRHRLAAEAARYARLVKTINSTIARINGDATMSNAELYTGISSEKQAGYEAWLIERYGGDLPERVAAGRNKYEALSAADKATLLDELNEVETAWAQAMKNGVPAESPGLDPLLRRHRTWVATMWDRPCPPGAYHGLADLHLGHPDFVLLYDAIAPGFSDYHAAAMKSHAVRLSG